MSIVSKIIIVIINIYQRTVSPDHGQGMWGPFFVGGCRFYPSCSSYMKDAIKKHGVFWGVLRGVRRILRCNPFSQGGIDSV